MCPEPLCTFRDVKFQTRLQCGYESSSEPLDKYNYVKCYN